jgi:hypothetical protein
MDRELSGPLRARQRKTDFDSRDWVNVLNHEMYKPAALKSFARFFLVTLFAVGGMTAAAHADAAAFDLTGPRLELKVTRAGKTLPISQVPNLQPGDRIWVHPDFPESQSAHYLLIVSFLRGSTNPPPSDWFIKAESWSKKVREEGIVVTVPEDAQQVVLFLAPQTGGDFSTLRSAIEGKPGTFVRASQDLQQASLDRQRLDKYLDEVKSASSFDLPSLHTRSQLLARSLGIKLDEQCFDKPSEQQAPCLMRNTDQLVLEDGHSQTMVAALTSGASADLIGTLSTTRIAGGGTYSPYIGSIVDMARVLEGLHNADYQYIPALALAKDGTLSLRLNNPPSFHKPKSVLVVGLPPVEAPQLPPMRVVDANQVFCLTSQSLVLPAEGAPLVFATALAHDFELHVHDKSGHDIDLPAKADSARGGFLIDIKGLREKTLDTELSGTLRGYWGFDRFDGPTFSLRSPYGAAWLIASADASGLIVGREDTLHLHSNGAACTEEVSLKNSQGKVVKADWKLPKSDELEVQVPLKDATPGAIAMLIKQHGEAKPDEVPVRTYAEAGHLEGFVLHAGDRDGTLKGNRLDEVAGLDLGKIHFAPAGLTRTGQQDELQVVSSDATASTALKADENLVAHVLLKDGRALELATTVQAPRPKVALLSKSVQLGASPSAIRFGTEDVLPQDARLTFFLKSEIPETFPHHEKIEVATLDSAFTAMLSLTDGSLILRDAQSVLATFDPAKSFGPSAFGPLRFRAVDSDDVKGDWAPLTNLVRIPTLKDIVCPDSPDKSCQLRGTNLFFIDSVASDPQFTRSHSVPADFTGSSLEVPRPNGTLLYLKLRDAPGVVNRAALPVVPE